MKRLSLSLFLILFTKLSGFCQNVIYFTPKKAEVTTSIGIAGAFKQDMRSAPVRFDQKICVDMKELCFDTGYAFQNSRFDITNKISYMPLLLNLFRLGVGVTHHFTDIMMFFLKMIFFLQADSNGVVQTFLIWLLLLVFSLKSHTLIQSKIKSHLL